MFNRLVCSVTPEGVGSFEGVLFPIFQIILQQDILGMNEGSFNSIILYIINNLYFYRIYALYISTIGSIT